MRGKGFLTAALLAALLAAFVSSAQGAVTIGSNLAGTPTDNIGCNALDCTLTNLSLPGTSQAQGGLTSPVNGTVTSWSFKSGSAAANPIRLRVLTQTAGGVIPSFRGGGTSGPVPAALGVNGPNPASVPIKIGDAVGLDFFGSLLEANTVSARVGFWVMPQLADDSTREASGTGSNVEALVQATIEPTNTLTFRDVTRNKKKGSARVTMSVPNAGELVYSGNGLSIAGPPNVSAPGDVQLVVKACCKNRKRLNAKGKVGASFQVTFRPSLGTQRTTTENLTLRKKRKKK